MELDWSFEEFVGLLSKEKGLKQNGWLGYESRSLPLREVFEEYISGINIKLWDCTKITLPFKMELVIGWDFQCLRTTSLLPLTPY